MDRVANVAMVAVSSGGFAGTCSEMAGGARRTRMRTIQRGRVGHHAKKEPLPPRKPQTARPIRRTRRAASWAAENVRTPLVQGRSRPARKR